MVLQVLCNLYGEGSQGWVYISNDYSYCMLIYLFKKTLTDALTIYRIYGRNRRIEDQIILPIKSLSYVICRKFKYTY